jgi:hypothetical protein
LPSILYPFTPISNSAIFPIEVPTARNFVPVAEITVGIPTPLLYGFSNNAVTFFRTIKVILLTSLGVGNYISFILLYLAIIFIVGYSSTFFSDYFLLNLFPFAKILLGVGGLNY